MKGSGPGRGQTPCSWARPGDDNIEAATEIGMRFVATRGSMSVGASQGGLPPDRVVEGEDAIPADTRRVIERFHDKSHGAMVNVAVVPCSPFSVSRDLMRESASLARAYGVRLHTYLAENDHDIAYSLEKFGCTPAQYAQDPGWTGADVWHAHCIKLDPGGIALFASTRTGVAHCPCSNMRLASGIAPIRRIRDVGVPVGLGAAARRCWDGPTSGAWPRACAPTWRCSTCGRRRSLSARCTTRWPACCCAPGRRRRGRSSMVAWRCGRDAWPRSTWGRWWSGTTR